MHPEQARLLKDVDTAELGRRIRDARTAKGLTQGELAGSEVSIGYVSRIEAGQRRPQAAVLERFAATLDVTLTQLLLGMSSSEYDEIRLGLDYAELALESGQAADAEARSAETLAAIGADRLEDLRDRARFVHARALEALGRVDDAIDELETLTASTVDRGVLGLSAGMVLSRCYRESGDFGRAIDIAERVLRDAEGTSLELTDEAVQLAVTLAAAHFQRGDVGQAVRVCRRALTKAEHLDSPKARAAAYWNASIMEAERGSVHDAIDLANKALALLREGSSARNLARLESELGSMQLRLDPPLIDDALHSLRRADEQFAWANATRADRARNDLSMARAHVLAGDGEAGRELAAQVYDAVAEQLPVVAADACTVQGHACALAGDRDGALASYRRAVALLTGVGADQGAAQLWYELADMLEELGEYDAARDAYHSAAAAMGLRSRVSRARTSVRSTASV